MAQENEGRPELAEDRVGTFKAGLIFGANGSKIDGDGYGPNFRAFNKLGANGGVRVWVVVHKNWQPGMELLFTQKGSFQKAGKGSIFQYKYTADYVQVPVMVSYVIDRRVQAYLGAAYGRLIRSRIQDGETGLIYDETNFRENVVDGLVGGSIYLDVKKHWVADIRYEISLADIVNGALKYQGSFLNFQQSKSLSIRIAYMF